MPERRTRGEAARDRDAEPARAGRRRLPEEGAGSEGRATEHRGKEVVASEAREPAVRDEGAAAIRHSVTALLLAAGAGRRMGRPKALVELAGEPLVCRALRILHDGGCAPLMVVVGAAAPQVRAVLPEGVHIVEATGWAAGMGASLRSGLAALEAVHPRPDAVLVHLVDLPGVTAEAIARLTVDVGPGSLRRAAYAGRPGHPVLIGREHWRGVAASAQGDAGARGYLAGNPAVELVECGDVADPDDVDTPEQLLRRLRG